jgi:selenide,water dikinase
MSKVNTVGAELAELRLVRAATDVTGYGLMGHLISLCRASGLSAEVEANAVPMISDEITDLIEQGCIPGGSRENLLATTVLVDWESTDDSQRILLTDAQTSGGLLLCVAEAKLEKVLGLLRQRRTPCAAVIGRITARRSRRPLICVKE